MSKKIHHWDENYEDVESVREYDEVGEILYYEKTGDYYHQYDRRVTTLYLDPLTGLLVGNIAAYEKWVK